MAAVSVVTKRAHCFRCTLVQSQRLTKATAMAYAFACGQNLVTSASSHPEADFGVGVDGFNTLCCLSNISVLNFHNGLPSVCAKAISVYNSKLKKKLYIKSKMVPWIHKLQSAQTGSRAIRSPFCAPAVGQNKAAGFSSASRIATCRLR